MNNYFSSFFVWKMTFNLNFTPNSDDVLAMAKHQHRSYATENSPYQYHDEIHRQFNHQKGKLVTKPNLRNLNRSEFRKTRWEHPSIYWILISFNDIFIICFFPQRNSKHEGHHANSKNQTYPYYPTPPPYAFTLPEHYYIVNATDRPTLEQITAERERIRVEFFSTYDVMTGVRIATTLGGFFGLMVFLVIYKSRGERLETINALKVMFASLILREKDISIKIYF